MREVKLLLRELSTVETSRFGPRLACSHRRNVSLVGSTECVQQQGIRSRDGRPWADTGRTTCLRPSRRVGQFAARDLITRVCTYVPSQFC